MIDTFLIPQLTILIVLFGGVLPAVTYMVALIGSLDVVLGEVDR